MVGTSRTFRTITFGQHDSCEVRVSDPLVSAFHCRVSESRGVFLVEDLGSTNGTWIRSPGRREKRVTFPHRLVGQERVRIGNTVLPWGAW